MNYTVLCFREQLVTDTFVMPLLDVHLSIYATFCRSSDEDSSVKILQHQSLLCMLFFQLKITSSSGKIVAKILMFSLFPVV